MQLLAPGQKGDILSFSANDHYLDVVTSKGASLIRISFSDAVSMMNTNDGIQVHRSHWVSRNAISSIERQNGSNHVVILTNGTQFPIARGRLASVRAYVDEVLNKSPLESVG
jgi:DNA-binding LytR/AlgR family response regulator